MDHQEEISTERKYNILCEKCKNIFFQKNFLENYQKIKNIFTLIPISVFHFHQKKWIEMIHLSILAIFFLKRKKKNIIETEEEYNFCLNHAKIIFRKKNLDYQDAWKKMEFSSIEDVIFQKFLRIENMQKKSDRIMNFSEKILDNYLDILNYSIFILIKKNL